MEKQKAVELLERYRDLKKRTAMHAYDVDKIPHEPNYISVADMKEKISVEEELRKHLKNLNREDLMELLRDPDFVQIADDELKKRHKII